MSAQLLNFPAPAADPAASATVADLPAVMSPAQLAAELDVSVRTLERWRETKAGPRYQNPEGTRFYRYYGVDVVAWLENKKPGAGTPGQNTNL